MVAGVGLEPHDLRVMSPTSYQLLYPAIYIFVWCRRPGSNRYGTFVPPDFKSDASACSATPASSPKLPDYYITSLTLCQVVSQNLYPLFDYFFADSKNVFTFFRLRDKISV